MDIYAETILDHYRNPRQAAPLAAPSIEHSEENHSCGDAITLQLNLENGKIVDIGWSGTGCAISQASMSMLAEELIGKSTEEMEQMTQKDIYAMLGVPIGPRRFKCALLSLHTLKNAIRRIEGKEVQGWLETVAVED
jgi:nitrogen fixation NifU-like protein